MQEGDLLQHYELIEPLGRGGCGEVFRARDTNLHIDVAVKILLPQFSHDVNMVNRFKLGARAAAQLRHPNIIQVLYLGETSDQTYFTVLEYLPGGMLYDRIRNTPLSLPEIVSTFQKMADAVSFAHNQGFIHRDLKPQNILYNADDEPIVTDFDLSRILGGVRLTTDPDTILGTPNYLSPEQAGETDVTARSDIYSLGIVLFRMLTGELPFDDPNPLTVIDMHLNDPPPIASSINPELPASVNAVVSRALSKTPEDRYASANEMAEDLMHALTPSLSTSEIREISTQQTKQRRQLTLTIVEGAREGVQFPITSDELMVVGYRSDDPGLFGLEDDYASSNHGRFERHGHDWVYIDHDSRNGSFLIREGKVKQQLAPQEAISLRTGDVLELGYTLVRMDIAWVEDE